MSRIENDNLVLSSEETREFLESIFRPNRDALSKRNEFFRDIDTMEIVDKGEGVVQIEIPGLSNLSDYEIIDNTHIVDKNAEGYWNIGKMIVNVSYQEKRILLESAGEDRYWPEIKNKNIYYDLEIMSNAVA